jgi:hypothetical protein
MMKLNLQWKMIDRDHVALVFDKPTWMVFQTTADSRGLDTQDMIAEALAKLLGPIVARRSNS